MRSNSNHGVSSQLVAAVLCGLLSTSSVAPYAFAQGQAPAGEGAQMTEQQKRDAARKHYSEGTKLLDAKDYQGCLREFKAADALIPAPQAKEKIALCHDGAGNNAEAVAAYESFIAAAEGKPKLDADRTKAQARVEEIKKAPVKVQVKSEPAQATIEVDGAPVGPAPMELQLAPGKHTIRVVAEGYQPMEQQVEILPAEPPREVAFALTPAAETAVVPPPPVIAPPPPTSPEADTGTEQRSNLPAYITLGVAGASAVVGTIFGVKALGDKSDFDDNPTTEKADDAERNALIADMAFGVAVTLGVTGAVLLLSNRDSSSEVAKRPASNTMQVIPLVGPHGGGAAATWRF